MFAHINIIKCEERVRKKRFAKNYSLTVSGKLTEPQCYENNIYLSVFFLRRAHSPPLKAETVKEQICEANKA